MRAGTIRRSRPAPPDVAGEARLLLIPGHFEEDGLLPRITEEDVEWLRPAFKGSPDPLAAMVAWARDIAEVGHLVWPAESHGMLTAPPLEHVLDRLTRREFGDSSSPEVQADFQLHAHAGTVAVVAELPSCDACAQEGKLGVSAR